MSASGSIRLSQVAAYDLNGNVMPVKFHISLYTNSGINVSSMPEFPGPRRIPNPDKDKPGEPATIPNPDFPKYLAARRVDGTVIPTTYENPKGGAPAQAHPFFEGAWESVRPDGFTYNLRWGGDVNLPQETPQVGWGNYFEPAGYSPGRFSKGAERTGLLEDTTPWSWGLSDLLSKDDKSANIEQEFAGMLFVMIYCDDQGDDPVFFMGRFVRMEPGQSG